MTRLALIRHGHTAWNRAHRIQGRTDIPLDAAAREQLAQLRLPAPWSDATLWSSPLSRAAQTAELIAGRHPTRDAALMEMDWGDWEGKHGTDLKADPNAGFRDIENWGWNYTPPNGESPADMRARIDPWLAQLRGDNVAVCHIGTMRIILAQAWGWDFSGPCPFTIKRNRLFVLEKQNDTWTAWPNPVRLEPKHA